mmetsp:Transcript_50148/g.107937  ORF Transcript_50148/g.107937 Transcript_50148/m.107937 type:complete len:747 (-) Transcript_50148:197-2437(-)
MSHQVDLDLLFHSHKGRKYHDKDLKQADEQAVNCLRCLAMDAVQAANSGHPGTPMAMAPVAYALWARLLRYDPQEPQWANRDRFVLSMGHASMLIYGLIHLAGVVDVGPDGEPCSPDNLPAKAGEKPKRGPAVTLEDIKNFRQHGSRCPGHPEYRWTAGVETTTGPLGQGVATSVGMAMAAKWFGATFNKPGYELFNYDIYALASDGDLQEGVSSEAASLAGHMKLDNLCWIWDNNQITIEGNTSWAISEDIPTRFMAFGWNVLRVGDANDVDALTRSMNMFKREKNRPTLIVVDSHIAWGAPTQQDQFTAHGAPLGHDEIAATKEVYGWSAEKFVVPEGVKEHFQKQMADRGGVARKDWDVMFQRYSQEYPAEAANLRHILNQTLPEGWDRSLKEFPPDPKGMATRQSSAKCLNQVAQNIPWMLGGSADLAPSCLTTLTFEGAGDFMAPATGWGSYRGRNLHFGIREHAMGSIMNGLAISKLRPFCSTFFVFSDYLKPPVRLSAIMELPNVWVFTHDSIGVGEDGPTHQPIEHLVALRSIPGLLTFRPCDANEAMQMWKFVATRTVDPVAIVLTRQPVPTLDRTKYGSSEGVLKGGYVIAGKPNEKPEVILMATGSEVSLMLEAHDALEKEGVKVRSVSMPCMELYRQQSQEYHESVLPSDCRARVSIEAATSHSWGDFTGLDGEHVGMITFGSSAPVKKLQQELGFTVSAVMDAARRVRGRRPRSLESYSEVQMKWKKHRSSEF